MMVYGSARAGGPLTGGGVPVPKTPITRPGTDIVSRLEATQNRVSPVGADGTDAESRQYSLGPSRRRGPSTRFDRVEIAAAYRRGMSAPKIAESLGCTAATVYAALKDQGVEIRTSGRRSTDGAE